MKFKDTRSKNRVEWEYRIFVDGNTYAKYITGGYTRRYDALVQARSQARYLILSGQAYEVEYWVDKMPPAPRLPSPYAVTGHLFRETIRR